MNNHEITGLPNVLAARLGTKTITENGTYLASDDNLDGYSSVTANVVPMEGYMPDPAWWDTNTIIDTLGAYESAAVVVFSAGSDIYNFTYNSSNMSHIITSDGSTYTSSQTHTWDTNQDIVDTKGRTVRYIIIAKTTGSINILGIEQNVFSSASSVLYVKWKGNMEVNSGDFNNWYGLEALEPYNALSVANIQGRQTAKYDNCYSLKKIIPYANLTNIGTTAQTQIFRNCHYIENKEQFTNNTSNITSYANTFENYLDDEITIDLTSVQPTLFTNAFFGSFIRVINLLNFPNTITNMSTVFANSVRLQIINGELDYTSVNTVTNTFSGCISLREVRFKANTINVTGVSVFASPLSRASLLSLIDGLVDRSTTTSYNVILGANNIAQLTAGELAQITAKNWTYS